MDKSKKNTNNWNQLINCLKKPDKFIPAFYWAKEYSFASGIKPRPIDLDDYCQIRIWMIDDIYIVLISQEYNNSSKSVTNACEEIVTAVVNSQGLHLKKVTFFESYEEYDRDDQPYFDHVYFDYEMINHKIVFKNPKWKQENNRFIKLLSV